MHIILKDSQRYGKIALERYYVYFDPSQTVWLMFYTNRKLGQKGIHFYSWSLT